MTKNEQGFSAQVVIAALNEEQGIGPTITELQKHLGSSIRFLVIDGQSTDATMNIAKSLGAEVLTQEGKGKGDAMRQGVAALDSKTRYVVFTDADYTYPAQYVPWMIEILNANSRVGMVIGDRFNGEYNLEKSLANPFYLGNRIIAISQHVLNGIKLSDPLSGLRVVRASILKNWKPKSTGFDIEAELNFYVERQGYTIIELPINYRNRLGQKKLKLLDGAFILKRIVVESVMFSSGSN